jgi:translation initiation factor IF-2
MAKIRIYELARDLNLTNKDLLLKLKEMEINVASHMSSLDDDAVKQIKSHIRGTKASELEETRVRPTVIRRRKKTTPKKSTKMDVEATSVPFKSEEEAKEEVVSDAVSETPDNIKLEEEKKPLLKAQVEALVSDIEEVKDVHSESKNVAAAKVIEKPKSSKVTEVKEAAKIIKKAPLKSEQKVLEPEEVTEKPITEESLKITKEPEKEPEAEREPEPLKEQPESQKKAPPLEPKEVQAPTEPKPVSTPPEKPKQPSPTKAVSEKKRKPVAKAKKTKKDMPAKIISLPKRPIQPEEVIQKEDIDTATSPQLTNDESQPPNKMNGDAKAVPNDIKPVSRDKKKKGKHRIAEEEPFEDRKFFKKKISFKKKEVVEGKDLYSGKAPRGRKGRKGAKVKELPTAQKTQITTAKAIKRRIKMDDAIILSELAKRMGIKASEMIAKLMGLGIMATVNQTIDFETAVVVASEFGYEIEKASFEEETILKPEKEEDPSKLVQRPPVITIMGHVDHGKTSLLDVIRKTRVTEIEAGGITQHIGAYHVTTEKGQMVFLDTPGHEAFSAMRSRGAQITDIVVLVVAADDGVMPQTIEAINHSKAAKVPIIVAVNKIDKANADPTRVQRELAEQGLVPEEWGGETIFVQVSAKQNQGIDDLLEMILLQAEMLELKANPNKLAAGYVIEAKLDSGRGPVATILVQDGTLNTSDPVVCGVHYGKVRALLNDLGKQVKSAGPSIPVELVGLSGVPMAGDELVAVEDEKDAKQISIHRTQKLRSKELAKTSRLSLEKLYEKMQQGEVKELNLIIRADVDGSIEAIRDSLVKLSNEEVSIHVIQAATGTITESDISLAAVSDAIIIGFNVRPNAKVSDLANEEHVDIRYHNIIYNVIKEIKDAIVGMMKSTFEERILGRAEVRQIFHVPKVGTIAGCYVTDGKIERGRPVRLLRDGIVIYEGINSSLRRYKDDMKEVQSGYECGVGIENYNDIKVGDIIENYYLEEIRPEVD